MRLESIWQFHAVLKTHADDEILFKLNLNPKVTATRIHGTSRPCARKLSPRPVVLIWFQQTNIFGWLIAERETTITEIIEKQILQWFKRHRVENAAPSSDAHTHTCRTQLSTWHWPWHSFVLCTYYTAWCLLVAALLACMSNETFGAIMRKYYFGV